MQQADRARRVAAGLNLAAIGIENAHAQVSDFRWLQYNQLVATDPGLAIGQRRSQRIVHRRDLVDARVQHDEVVAQTVHLDEGDAHDGGHLCAGGGRVQWWRGRDWIELPPTHVTPGLTRGPAWFQRECSKEAGSRVKPGMTGKCRGFQFRQISQPQSCDHAAPAWPVSAPQARPASSDRQAAYGSRPPVRACHRDSPGP